MRKYSRPGWKHSWHHTSQSSVWQKYCSKCKYASFVTNLEPTIRRTTLYISFMDNSTLSVTNFPTTMTSRQSHFYLPIDNQWTTMSIGKFLVEYVEQSPIPPSFQYNRPIDLVIVIYVSNIHISIALLCSCCNFIVHETWNKNRDLVCSVL
jgi:hypothetical protein